MFGSAPNIERRDKVVIENIMFIENKGFRDIYIRPYVTNFNGFEEQKQFKNAVEDFVGRNRGKDPYGMIGENFSDTIKLRVSPGDLARIPNGWHEPRFQFFMLVSINLGHNMYRRKYLIQGYTDHKGIIERHGRYVFDHNMVFICNSVLGFTETIRQDDFGGTSSMITSSESYNIFRDVDSAYNELTTGNFNRGMNNNGSLTTLRPTDIHSSLSVNSFKDDEDRIEFFSDSSGILTSRTELTSNRLNGDPLSFISKIVSSYKVGAIDSHIMVGSTTIDNTSSYITASNVASRNEPKMSANTFFSNIMSSTNDVTSTMFTVRDLNYAFNGILENTDINTGIVHVIPSESNVDVFSLEDNISTDPEYVKCIELLQSTISLASSYGATEINVVFSITGTMSNDANIIRFESPMFRHMDDNTCFNIIEAFKDKFTTVALKRYSGKDLDAYIEGYIHINLIGDSVIEINYRPDLGTHHNNIRHIVLPSYADSLFNSCIGKQQDKNMIINDLEYVLDIDLNSGIF